MARKKAHERNILGRPRREAQVDVFVAAIAAGDSVADASAKAKFCKATGYQVMKRPEVAERLAEARRAAMSAAAEKLAALTTKAVDTLGTIMAGDAADTVKRAAADTVLSHAQSLGRDLDADAKLAALTAQIVALEGR